MAKFSRNAEFMYIFIFETNFGQCFYDITRNIVTSLKLSMQMAIPDFLPGNKNEMNKSYKQYCIIYITLYIGININNIILELINFKIYLIIIDIQTTLETRAETMKT